MRYSAIFLTKNQFLVLLIFLNFIFVLKLRPHSLQSAYTLGILLHITGVLDDARLCYAQAFAIYQEQLGPEHESTLDIQAAYSSLQSERMLMGIAGLCSLIYNLFLGLRS